MRYRPSKTEIIISKLPIEWQIKCLEVIKEEHDRFERGDFTEEEKWMFKKMEELGEKAAEYREKIFLEAYIK